MKSNLFLTAFTLVCCSVARSQSTNNAFSFSSTVENKTKVWSKRNNVVNINPNPSYNGEVSVSSKTDQALHFYIFDLEGTLIYQTVLKTKDKKTITDLNKGTYMYNVFANDESIEEGKLIIK
jgi:hypothetical protein